MIIVHSCDGRKFVENDNTTLSAGSRLEEQNQLSNSGISDAHKNSGFIDTLRLKEMGIACQKVESDSNDKTWRLTLIDTIPKSKQIQSVTYKISAYLSPDDGSVLFQLDSVFVKLPKNLLAFGFNEDGTYLHSYESLQNPGVAFEDYNFDDIVDFSVISGGSGKNVSRYYYIFNPSTNDFNTPIRMANASFDRQKKLVYQSWHVSAAEGGQSIFRFTPADTLLLTRSRNKFYVDSLDSYVIEVTTLESNGVYSFMSDTVRRE